MAYTVPTVDDFRTRFDEFANEDEFTEEKIQILLDEAGRKVDTTWTGGDYTTAIMYYAAHLLQYSIDFTDGGGGGFVTSERIGQISVSYSRPSGSSKLETTQYGSAYKDLLKVNIPAVTVI